MSSLPYLVLTFPRPTPQTGAKGRSERSRRLVLIALAILMEAGETAPTCARLGKLIGLSVKSIRRLLHALEAEGAITTVKGAGRGRGVQYRIVFDRVRRTD